MQGVHNSDTNFPDDTGEYLGRHSWDKEMLEETRGEFIFSHVSFFMSDLLAALLVTQTFP